MCILLLLLLLWKLVPDLSRRRRSALSPSCASKVRACGRYDLAVVVWNPAVRDATDDDEMQATPPRTGVFWGRTTGPALCLGTCKRPSGPCSEIDCWGPSLDFPVGIFGKLSSASGGSAPDPRFTGDFASNPTRAQTLPLDPLGAWPQAAWSASCLMDPQLARCGGGNVSGRLASAGDESSVYIVNHTWPGRRQLAEIARRRRRQQCLDGARLTTIRASHGMLPACIARARITRKPSLEVAPTTAAQRTRQTTSKVAGSTRLTWQLASPKKERLPSCDGWFLHMTLTSTLT